MSGVYERITRFFLGAVDPHDFTDTTPRREIWPNLKAHIRPMRRIIAASVLVTVVAAGVEVWLIRYAGRVVDMLATTTPGALWRAEGTRLPGAALIVLLLRPFALFLRLAVNDIFFDCNMATLLRWRL
ncbi:MAG TPA: hypothetical protein DIU07_20035 [Rhodobacteraceae bacterium]|nr:hypothetical protein [Paracoccaceae bacterium]